MDLYEELKQKTAELDFSIKSLRKTGNAYAEAEKNYKILINTQAGFI